MARHTTRGAITFSAPGQDSKERRRVTRDVAERVKERPEEKAFRKRKSEPLPDAAVGGPFGPGLIEGGYWGSAALVVPPHQATSRHIAGIYPFVADGGLGTRGPAVGVDLNADTLWHFSPWDAYADSSERGSFSTNILVIGAYRAGKSATVKCLVTRSIAFGHQCVVPSDSKGEWVKVAEAVEGTVIRLAGASNSRLNPLDRGPRRTGVSDEQHEQMVKQRRTSTLLSLVEMALGRGELTAAEYAALHLALARAVERSGDRPTLRRVYEELGNISRGDTDGEDALQVAAAQPRFVLRRFVDGDLSGLFEDESTVQFDHDSPMVVVDTSELFARGDLVAQLTQVCTTAWIQAVISDRDAHRTRYVVREEGWRDMSSLHGLQMYQQWLKLSRHYGISNIVILHKMGDLDAVGDANSQERNLAYSIVGDIENKFIFRVNHQEHAALRERLNIPPQHVRWATELEKGRFLAYVGQFAYYVDCFSTSTPWEYELFNTDEAMDLSGMDPEEVEFALNTAFLDELWPATDTSLNGWLTANE